MSKRIIVWRFDEQTHVEIIRYTSNHFEYKGIIKSELAIRRSKVYAPSDNMFKMLSRALSKVKPDVIMSQDVLNIVYDID